MTMQRGDPLDREVAFGKYRDGRTTWRQVVDHDGDYARWAATEADHSSLDDDLREALLDAVEDDEWAF